MGLFDIFKKSEPQNGPTQEEKEEFVYAKYKEIEKLCDYGANIDVLSHAQRVFYVALLLETRVYDGGFPEYFFECSGNFYEEAVPAFRELGAYDAARICERAFGCFGEPIPKDRRAREDFLSGFTEDWTDELLYTCQTELSEQANTLTDLYYDYILRYEI